MNLRSKAVQSRITRKWRMFDIHGLSNAPGPQWGDLVCYYGKIYAYRGRTRGWGEA